jgi:osmoprotectant transport system substrate-binding protein
MAAMRALTRMAAAATTLAASAALVTGLAAVPAAQAAAAPKIIIGSESFPENEVLAYVYGDALSNAGISVTVKPNLGQRETIQPALNAGQINMTPEYLGNYLSYLNPKVGTLSVAATYATLKPLVAAKGQVLGNYSKAADSDAIAVTQANATKYKLKSIGDLKKVASSWTFGGPAECKTRITCVPGLKKYYGITFKAFKTLDEDGPITVSALKNGQVQVARIFSSDTTVSSDHFVVLADPKDFQGAGNIVPVMRKAQATPAVLAAVNKVSANLTTADLVSFNVAVETDKQNATTVAAAFVKANKL